MHCMYSHPCKYRKRFSRPDPCSVDFGRETPKFRFEFCRGFFGGFFPPIFSKKKGPKKSTKNPPQNSPGTLFGKIPLGFLQKPFLEIFLANYLCIGFVPGGRFWPDLISGGRGRLGEGCL